MYNYGGLRAHNTTYQNVDSVNPGTFDVYFSDGSRNTEVDNMTSHENLFSDVKESDYYYEAVNWATSNSIAYGITSNKFGVGEITTRQDAIILIWRALGRKGEVISLKNNNIAKEKNNGTNQNIVTCFSDVNPNASYAGAIKWGIENGIINGVKACSNGADGIFGIDNPIKRKDFVTMLWRAAGKPQYDINTEEYDDIDKNSYYYDAVMWARYVGISNGVGNNLFKPDESCNREQAITFLYRFMSVLK